MLLPAVAVLVLPLATEINNNSSIPEDNIQKIWCPETLANYFPIQKTAVGNGPALMVAAISHSLLAVNLNT